MKTRNIDLSDIKDNDLDKTSSFTDLMTRSERKNRKLEKEKELLEENNNDDILDMVDERKKSTKDLTIELEKAKEEYNNNATTKKSSDDEDFGKTQILDLTRQMKFNFEKTKEENVEKKKNGVSILNVIGEVNLLCIGYYIYLLVFTNYQDIRSNYLINGSIIVALVLLFGLSVISKKGLSKFFNILNILAILAFILFNAYTLIK